MNAIKPHHERGDWWGDCDFATTIQTEKLMSDERPKKKKKSMSGKETYNAVTDTVTGANVRLLDNLLQAAGALIGLGLGAGGGALVAWQFTFEYLYSCLIGAVVGLIGGVFVVGLFLMIFRAVKHARGEHD